MAENPVFSTRKTKKFSLKGILIGFFLFIALIGIGAFCFFYQQEKIKKDIINFLPAETNFYLRIKTNSKEQQVKNLKELLNRFPNYQKFSEKLGETFEIIKNQNPFLKNFDFDISKEIILVSPSPLHEKIEEIPFIFIFPNPDLKKVEKITRDFEKQIKEKKDWEIKRENYKGRTIFKAKPKSYSNLLPQGSEIALTISDEHFFLAFKIDNIKKIIDVVEDQKLTNLFKKDRKKSLNESQEYKKLKNYFPKEYLIFTYGQLDLTKILKTTGGLTVERLPPPLSASLREILNLPFLKEKEQSSEKVIFASAIIAENDGLRSEGYYLDLRKESILPSPFSIKDSLANFLPAKIGEKEFIYYSEGKNLKNSFDQLEKILKEKLESKEKEEMENFFKKIEEEIGVNLKDIFSLFEGNFAFFICAKVQEIEKPTVGLVFKIENEEKIKENFLKIKLPKIPFDSDLLGLERARKRAKDAKIMADLQQLRAMAEIIYDEEGSYRNINCNYYSKYGSIKSICNDIENQIGSQPKIYASNDKYCAYSRLNEPEAYYCIDSKFSSIKTYIDPGQEGFCTNKTFVCPKMIGMSPLKEIKLPETISFTKEVVDGFEIYSLPLLNNAGLFFSFKEKKLIFTFDKESLVEILRSLEKEEKKLKDSEFFAKEFQKLPENLTQISFLYPYGFSNLIKQGASIVINLFANFLSPYQEIPSPENLTPLVFEFLEKGIFPYLKVLNFASAYSFSPEKGLVISKGKIKIAELSEKEKRETEEFWENIKDWIEEKTQTLSQTELEVPQKQVEYQIFSREIAYRGTTGQNARLPIVRILVPQNTKISRVDGFLEAFNRDPTYARSVGIAIGKEIPTNCKANYYLTLGPSSLKSGSFNLDPNLFKPGVNLITSWISTYGEWGGVESWVSLKLKFYYSGESPKLLEEISILETPIDPINCKLK